MTNQGSLTENKITVLLTEEEINKQLEAKGMEQYLSFCLEFIDKAPPDVLIRSLISTMSEYLEEIKSGYPKTC